MKNNFQILKNKIKNKKVNILIFGLGFVGLKLSLHLIKEKYFVRGFDTDKNKINFLKKSKSPVSYIKDEDIKKYIKKKFLTNNFHSVKNADIIILCLPTPLSDRNIPDLSSIKNCMKKIKNYLRPNQLLILESTSYPGTTKEIIKPYVKDNTIEIGKNYFIGYSPEREDPGSSFKFNKITKVCSGLTNNCGKLCQFFYSQIVDKTILAKSTDYAEFSKLYENIYRSVNIGFVNEMKIISNKMGYDIFEIIRLASTKPYGFKTFLPGPGIGGHCIPIDPYYLSWKANKFGIKTKFIELAGKINIETTNWIFKKISKKIKKRSKILLFGIAYKKNINDLRESAGIKIMKKFLENGYSIDYTDKYIPQVIINVNNVEKKINSINYNTSTLKKYDCVILCADHDYFDYKKISNSNKLIFDTRGRFKHYTKKNIINL